MDYFELLKRMAPIGAIGAFIFLYFDKEYKEYKEVKKLYFEKVLVNYIGLYKKNKDINPIKFIKKNYTYKDYYIPPYIGYLMDNNEKIKLHKVLIEDYKTNFPSERSSVINTFFKLCRITDFIYLIAYLSIIFICLIFTFSGIALIILAMFNGFKNLSFFITIIYLILGIGGGLALIKFRYFFKDRIVEDDEYSTNEEWIKKHIDKKVENYNHNSKKDYLK